MSGPSGRVGVSRREGSCPVCGACLDTFDVQSRSAALGLHVCSLAKAHWTDDELEAVYRECGPAFGFDVVTDGMVSAFLVAWRRLYRRPNR